MTYLEHTPLAAQMDAAWPVGALTLHGERVPYVEPVFSAYVGEILKEAPAAAPIAEIGAGIGYLGSVIPAEFRANYVQTELGPQNCIEASKRNPDLTTIAARAQELPFQAESVGAVIARNVFDMVDTPAVIAEIGRVLQPGGLAVHMRDHQPSLVWVQQHAGVGKTKRLIPHYDADGAFRRYQVVNGATLQKFLAGNPVMTAEEISDPHYQEFARGGDQNGTSIERLKIVSRLASVKSERVTPAFSEIMDKKLGSWFKKAGLEANFETFSGEYTIPMDIALKLGWPKDANCRQSESDGYWWQGYDEQYTDDAVHIIHSFDVVAAIKKRA